MTSLMLYAPDPVTLFIRQHCSAPLKGQVHGEMILLRNTDDLKLKYPSRDPFHPFKKSLRSRSLALDERVEISLGPPVS